MESLWNKFILQTNAPRHEYYDIHEEVWVQLFSENHHGFNNAAVCRVLHIDQILTTFGKITLEKKVFQGLLYIVQT